MPLFIVPLLIAGGIIGLAKGAFDFVKGKEASRKQRKESKRQAAQVLEEVEEEVVLEKKRTQRLLEMNQAAFASAGLGLIGTPGRFLETIESESDESIALLRKRGERSAFNVIRQGRSVSRSTSRGADSALVSGTFGFLRGITGALGGASNQNLANSPLGGGITANLSGHPGFFGSP